MNNDEYRWIDEDGNPLVDKEYRDIHDIIREAEKSPSFFDTMSKMLSDNRVLIDMAEELARFAHYAAIRQRQRNILLCKIFWMGGTYLESKRLKE